MPHFVCWQQAINRDLLNPMRFMTHFAVFKVETLIRGDAAALNLALSTQRQNGVITANQWRRPSTWTTRSVKPTAATSTSSTAR
jgi:hypothetical protein